MRLPVLLKLRMNYIFCLRGIRKAAATSCFNRVSTLLFPQRCIHTAIAPYIGSCLNFQTPSLTTRRSFWESFPNIKPFLHEKDGLNRENYELIYRTKYFNYVFYGQLVSLTGIAAQVFFSCYYAYQSYTTGEIISATEIAGYAVTYDLVTLSVIGLMSVQNFLLLIAAQSAILRVYYNDIEDEYVFVSLAWNPFKSRLTYCKPASLKELDPPHALIIFGSHKLHDRRIFLRFDQFKTMWHYNRLLVDSY